MAPMSLYFSWKEPSNWIVNNPNWFKFSTSFLFYTVLIPFLFFPLPSLYLITLKTCMKSMSSTLYQFPSNNEQGQTHLEEHLTRNENFHNSYEEERRKRSMANFAVLSILQSTLETGPATQVAGLWDARDAWVKITRNTLIQVLNQPYTSGRGVSIEIVHWILLLLLSMSSSHLVISHQSEIHSKCAHIPSELCQCQWVSSVFLPWAWVNNRLLI